jgi:WD40 repeat protein
VAEPGQSQVSRVFVSYSRKDGGFARKLLADLTERGFEAYLDEKDILPGEDWQSRLAALIVRADSIVFIISPDSIASKHCSWEADEAVRLSKRLLPVVYRAVPDDQVPGRIKRLNYIFMTGDHDYSTALDKLGTALKVDIAWVRKHTWLAEQAVYWRDPREGGDHALLRGAELAEAELWISSRPAEAQEPTELQRAYIKASREAETARAEKERRQIRRTRLFQRAVGVLIALGTVGVIWQDIETTKREQSVFLNPVDKAVSEQQFDRAMRYALQTLPPKGAFPWEPVETAIEGKLAGAALSNRLSFATGGHTSPLTSTSFSPDGKHFVTTSADHTARIWDVATGREMAVLRGHADSVKRAEYSLDGSRIVTASADNTARVWDAGTGKELAVLASTATEQESAQASSGKQNIVKAGQLVIPEMFIKGLGSARFSSDGLRIVTASGDNTVRIWATETGKQLAAQKIPGALIYLYNAEFSPDGGRVVSAWSDGARVWDTLADSEPAHLKGKILSYAGFSPDGLSIITASKVPITGVSMRTESEAASESVTTDARLWDVASGNATLKLEDSQSLQSLAFSPDGKYIAGFSGSTLRLWEAATGKVKSTLEGHVGPIASVSFSRDGKRLASASASVANNLMTIVISSPLGSDDARIWDVETGKQLVVFRGHAAQIRDVKFSPDGNWILTASDDGTARLSLANTVKNAVTVIKDSATILVSATFSPDGKKIVTTSDHATVRIWDAATGQQLNDLIGHSKVGLGVVMAAYSSNGNRIVTAGSDRTARIWDAATGKELVVFRGHQAKSCQINYGLSMASFSPDGSRVASAGDDGTVRIWNADTGDQIHEFKGHCLKGYAAFSASGEQLVTAASGGLSGAPSSARIWNANTGAQIATLPIDVGGMTMISLSLNGQKLLVAYGQKPAQVFDAVSGALVSSLKSYTGMIYSAAFSPDGARIVTASADKTARLWDTLSGEEIAVLSGHRDRVFRAEFNSDGTKVVTSSFDGTAIVWDVSFATQVRGAALRDRVCSEVLTGVQEYTASEVADPFLRIVDQDNAVARNPCLRRGPLSQGYYAQRVKLLSKWAEEHWAAILPKLKTIANSK